ncbi:MAG: DUF6491 family protein [Rhodothalassiaceae bacterium]
MKTLTTLAAVAVASLTLSGLAQADSFRKMDAGYWSRIDLKTVVVYDWSMRTRYRLDLRDDCLAMHTDEGARLAATWVGRIDGSFRDRMIFGGTSCYIDHVEKLNDEEFAALLDGRTLQMAGLD